MYCWVVFFGSISIWATGPSGWQVASLCVGTSFLRVTDGVVVNVDDSC